MWPPKNNLVCPFSVSCFCPSLLLFLFLSLCLLFHSLTQYIWPNQLPHFWSQSSKAQLWLSHTSKHRHRIMQRSYRQQFRVTNIHILPGAILKWSLGFLLCKDKQRCTNLKCLKDIEKRLIRQIFEGKLEKQHKKCFPFSQLQPCLWWSHTAKLCWKLFIITLPWINKENKVHFHQVITVNCMNMSLSALAFCLSLLSNFPGLSVALILTF